MATSYSWPSLFAYSFNVSTSLRSTKRGTADGRSSTNTARSGMRRSASLSTANTPGAFGSFTPRCPATKRLPSSSSRGRTPLRVAAARTSSTAAARTPASGSSKRCTMEISAASKQSLCGIAAAAAANTRSADSRVAASAASSTFDFKRCRSDSPASFTHCSRVSSPETPLLSTSMASPPAKDAASRSAPLDASAGAAASNAARTCADA